MSSSKEKPIWANLMYPDGIIAVLTGIEAQLSNIITFQYGYDYLKNMLKRRMLIRQICLLEGQC